MKIILEANDGERFEVNRDVISFSTTLTAMLQDSSAAKNQEEKPIPVNIRGVILLKAIQWCENHKKTSTAANNQRAKKIQRWDANFFNVDDRELSELVLVANYLGILGLFNASFKAFCDRSNQACTKDTAFNIGCFFLAWIPCIYSHIHYFNDHGNLPPLLTSFNFFLLTVLTAFILFLIKDAEENWRRASRNYR